MYTIRTRSLEGLKAGAAALSDFLGVDAAEEDRDDGVLAALAFPLALPLAVAVVVIGGGFRLLPPSSLAGAGVAALSPPSVLILPLPLLPLWPATAARTIR